MIHLFQRSGINLALDIGSGAVHVLDDTAFALLQIVNEDELKNGTLVSSVNNLNKQFGAETIKEVFEELVKLTKQELLYANDGYEEFKDRLGAAPVKAMCLHIAHDCNLRCRYCFASTGDFGAGRKLMDFEIAKKSIDLLISLSGTRHNLEVDFFGGEPMMNFGVVRQTVAYARSIEKAHNKNFRFTLTTNGLALNDDNIPFINKEMSNVVLSIDGRREVNDRMRVKIDGSGSYDSILPKFQKLVANRGDKEYYVRGTYTRYNLDFDKDVLSMFDAGFDQISVEPVVGPEEDDYSIRKQDLAAIEESYERLMNEMANRRKAKKGDFNFFHFMLDLDNGPCAIKRLKGCGSGNEYVAVTPDGEIYPCHQFAGNADFIMGTVDSGITRNDIKQKFANTNIFSKPSCTKCWAKFFCSGGCNANNQNFEGDLCEPYKLACDLEKMRLECAIALKASVQLSK